MKANKKSKKVSEVSIEVVSTEVAIIPTTEVACVSNIEDIECVVVEKVARKKRRKSKKKVAAKAKVARVFSVEKTKTLFLDGKVFNPTEEQKIEMKFFKIDGITSRMSETKIELFSFDYNTPEEYKEKLLTEVAQYQHVSLENIVVR